MTGCWSETRYIRRETRNRCEDRQIPTDVEQEIRNILDGMKATLGSEMTMNDLVSVQVFCPI